jgi:hypothetical protein
MRKKIIKWVLLCLFLIPTISAYWNVEWVEEDIIKADFYLVNISPQVIEPGKTILLNITLKNIATSIATNMNATLDPGDISPIDPVGIRKKRIDGVKVQNENFQLSILVHVDQNVSEGVYDVPLELYWEDHIRRHWGQTLKMGIEIKGNANIRVAKISTNPVEFRSDTEKNKVTITIENAGKTVAKSVKANINLEKPFLEAYSGSSSDFISQIPPEGSHDFIIALDIDKDAIVGEYSLPLKLTYRTHDEEYDIKEDIKIKISEKADFEVQNISYSKSAISPGDDFIVNIPIKNIGQENAENVKAVINTKSYFTGAKTDYLGEIKVGESKVATFELTVDRDTTPDNYENDLKLIWNDGEERLEDITSFGITISKIKNEGGISNTVLILLGMVGIVIIAIKRKNLWGKK